MNTLKNLLVVFALTHLCIGCHGIPARARGGSIIHDTGKIEVKQPDNPKDAAKQDVDTSDVFDFAIPPGAIVTIPASVTTTASGAVVTNPPMIVSTPSNCVPVPLHREHHEKSHAQVGASQKDELAEIAAKLHSTTWWSVFGFMLFAGGVFASLWPPATVVLGGWMPGAGIAAAGLLIAVLPVLLVGHETFIIVAAVGAIGAAGAIWFVHKHGGLTAELQNLKTQITKI